MYNMFRNKTSPQNALKAKNLIYIGLQTLTNITIVKFDFRTVANINKYFLELSQKHYSCYNVLVKKLWLESKLKK